MENGSSTSTHAGELPPAPFGSLPVLVYDHGFDPASRRQTVVRIAAAGSNSPETRVVPELTNNNYHVTPRGWVFISEPGTMRARLWNPTSGESVELPRMEQPLPANWKFLYCHVGAGSRWIAHEYDIGNVGLPPEYTPPRRRFIGKTAAVNGKFYFVETGKLGVLEFTPALAFSYLEYPHLELPDGSNCGTSFLVSSHGELFEVHVFLKDFTTEILAVRVCRIDLSGERPAFCDVDDLGDRTFLLGDSNSVLLCSASKHGVKGNRVYFMRNMLREADGGLLRVYDLGDPWRRCGRVQVFRSLCATRSR
ncbi:hypothetical protein E2562_021203 [Oryza meyeriana var. granulata]|uniref:KIB1-4 beta-propeller domain-containing protein n=1 Tax=Oryza meyeriana var. granulata TaxID=110450 RepID=A0A6G1DZ72_9ORYZ|nr:hypothetical protein E2562_021203 [Oryza meyeriana var. granulata]